MGQHITLDSKQNDFTTSKNILNLADFDKEIYFGLKTRHQSLPLIQDKFQTNQLKKF